MIEYEFSSQHTKYTIGVYDREGARGDSIPSGLSVAAFCARESISVSSFLCWRALAAPAGAAAQAQTPVPQAAFVDLGVLTSGAASRLELKLDLGGSLVLHLVRG